MKEKTKYKMIAAKPKIHAKIKYLAESRGMSINKTLDLMANAYKHLRDQPPKQNIEKANKCFGYDDDESFGWDILDKKEDS